MSEEYEEESLVFVNDEGEETEFTILRSLEHEGKEYILVTENPDAEDVEVQILRLDGEEETDEILKALDKYFVMDKKDDEAP